MDSKKTLEFLKSFLVWFAVFYLAFWGYSYFTGEKEKAQTEINEVQLKLLDDTPVVGRLMQLELANFTNKTFTWESVCDNPDSFKVSGVLGGQSLPMDIPGCTGKDRAVLKSFELPPQTKHYLNFPSFNYSVFGEPGSYKIGLKLKASGTDETLLVETDNFELSGPGFFRKLFRFLVTEPLFNSLVALINVLPGHPLGWAVVLLTLIVRVILFFPNQKAMGSQRKLQKLQPQVEALRKKYEKNQQMLALKTMEFYKAQKVSPMSSCLPMLAQMPFLIGLYLVVKDGMSPHLNFLLYSFQQGFDLSTVDTEFFGLNLEVPNLYVLPVLVGVAQFAAIKLSMMAAKKSDVPKKKKDKKDKAPSMMEQMEQMQKMMLWVLPVMIAVFTATFPAAVGIYWLTSTVFGIGQQKLVNWQLDRPQVRRKES